MRKIPTSVEALPQASQGDSQALWTEGCRPPGAHAHSGTCRECPAGLTFPIHSSIFLPVLILFQNSIS